MAVAIAVAAGVAALPSAGATSSKPKPRHVAVKDDFFDPKRITVKKGTKVVWAWKGSERHNVAVAQGPLTFRAGTRRKGTFKHTFRKRGTYSIVCTIHAPDMHMTVKVK